jgi:predicted site-specific integrase-resolvase
MYPHTCALVDIYGHNELMRLSAWAKQTGLSYQTAWRMWKAGLLPVPAEQLATGTVIVHAPTAPVASGVALYARVSGGDQKADLERQLSRLTEYAVSKKMCVTDAVKEVGSGMNGHRKGLMRLLRDPQAQTIVVEHRDRLMRFGFECVEAALAAQGLRIVVVEKEEAADDIVRDLHEVIVSMCARLYGKRSAAHRANKAMDALHG